MCTHSCANLWPAEAANQTLIIEAMSPQPTTSKIDQQQYSKQVLSDLEWCKTVNLVAFHKHNTLLHCCWSILRSSLGVTLLIFSLIIRTWSAASAAHTCRLAQGWVHTTSTKVATAPLLCWVLWVIDRKYRGSTNLREVRSHKFNRLQSPSGKTLQQAVHVVFYTYKWLQFAIADTVWEGTSCANNSNWIYMLYEFR